MAARTTALVLTGVLVVYFALLGWRGVLLVADGRPVPVIFGLAVLVLPLLAGYLIWQELRMGFAAQELGRALAAEGEGAPDWDRRDRVAARTRCEGLRADAMVTPTDWRAWYRLADAYGAAGDTRRGRAALRRAISLYR